MADDKKTSKGVIAAVAVGVFLLLIAAYYFLIRKPATTTKTTNGTTQPTTTNTIMGFASNLLSLGSTITTAATAGSHTTAPGSTVPQSGSGAYSVVGGIGSGGNVLDPAGNIIGQDGQDGSGYYPTGDLSNEQPYSTIGLS